MSENVKWSKIKTMIAEKLSLSEKVVDLMSVSSLLSYCVAGYSVSSICRRLDCDADYVVNILTAYLDFKGFDTDTDFNPYAVFKKSTSLVEFTALVNSRQGLPLDIPIDVCYNICSKYDSIRKEIAEAYGE